MLKSQFLIRVLLTFFVTGATVTAQDKGTFQAGIDYSAGFPVVASNTGELFGGIAPVEVHSQDSNGRPLDFNGDGKPDLVAAAACSPPGSGSSGFPGCSRGGAVVVYLSNGDGSFGSPIVTGIAVPSLRSMAVADFNGDGKLDVAVANDCISAQDCSSGSLTILLGNGDGTFSTGASYLLGGIVSGANTIVVSDFNLDGKADLAVGIDVTAIALDAVQVYLGNGDGTFQPPHKLPAFGNSALPLTAGDFNGDGKPDVVTANFYSPGGTSNSSLSFFPGNGDGTFGQPSVTVLPYVGPLAIAAADFNSDGRFDVVVDGSFGIVAVAFGNGDGTFQAPTQYNLTGSGESIAVADMSGDGKPDIVVGGGESFFNAATLLVNDGTGNFNNISTFSLGGTIPSVGVGDFNADGKNDIALLSYCAQLGLGCPDGTVSVLLGNGDGTMRSAQYVTTGTQETMTVVAAADFDGDGLQDLVVPTCQGCGATGFSLLLADGAGGYKPPIAFTGGFSAVQSLVTGDFNGDGKPDVAVFSSCDATCTGTSVTIFLNAGGGTFGSPFTYEGGGTTPLTITTGDFNGDGKLDIALLNQGATSYAAGAVIGILLGNGDGTFYSLVRTPIDPQNTVWWLAAADFNGDGKADLVVSETTNDISAPGAESAQIFLSNGDGQFTAGQLYASGGYNSTVVATGDINGDGKADIVLANLCDPTNGDAACARGTLKSLLGDGVGTFQDGPTQIIQDGNLHAISLADVNGDGKLDAIASTSTGIAVAFGKGDGTFQAPTIYAALEVTQNSQLAIADLNGDGGLDIVQPSVDRRLAILYNRGFSNGKPQVTLQSSQNPSVYSQQITFTATVTSVSGSPTGTVTFMDGSSTLGSALLVGGSASLTTSALQVGSHSIVASYGRDTTHQAANSTAITQSVQIANVTVGLTSNANPSTFSQTVTFTASLAPQYGGSVTGTLTFKDGANSLGTVAVSGNQASVSTSALPSGAHSITASYSGDANFNSGLSTALSQAVNQASTTLSIDSFYIPADFNQLIQIFGMLDSSQGADRATGTVTFKDGAVNIGTVPVSNKFFFLNIRLVSLGNHSITASYSGDANYSGSISSVLIVPVTTSPTHTAVSSSANPSPFGKAVSFTATVSSVFGGTPTGKVTFMNGSAALGTVNLINAIAKYSTTKLPAGMNSITAVYGGDTNYRGSTSPILVQSVSSLTTITLAASPNPSMFGQGVALTALVASSSGAPIGQTVTFTQGAIVVGTATLDAGGAASIAISSFGVGTKVIKASYAGDANFAPSTSNTVSLVVNKAGTTTSITSSLNPSTHGQSVTFTATVAPQFGGTASGLVAFMDGTTTLKTVVLNAGVAAFSTNKLIIGTHNITANYKGNTSFSPSSGGLTQTVN